MSFVLSTVREALPECMIRNILPETLFPRASTDSRDIREGELFFAIRAARDGHQFAFDALERGAGGLVIDHVPANLPKGAPTVLVPDTSVALQSLAKFHRRRMNPRIVAITGSVGKTTTKDFTAQLLRRFAPTRSSRKSFNNWLGVPLTLLELEPEDEYLVVEIGADRLGSIRELTGLALPDIAILTNVGYAHVGKFGSLSLTLRAKLEIFDLIAEDGIRIINGDDKLLSGASIPGSGRLIKCGFGGACDVRVSISRVEKCETHGTITVGGDSGKFLINGVGDHLVWASIFAVSVAIESGIPLQDAVESIATLTPPQGRQTFFEIGSGSSELIVIDDSYNSSPDAVLSALRTLVTLPVVYRVAVLGEMKELGAFSVEAHKKVGENVASVADFLIVTGEDTRHLAEAAANEGLDRSRILRVDSALQVIDPLRAFLDSSECSVGVLVKGSRFRHMERVVLALRGVAEVRCELADCQLYTNCADCPALEKGGAYVPAQAVRE